MMQRRVLCERPCGDGKKMAFAYCSNGVNEKYTANDIVGGILRIYFNRPYKIPAF